MDKPLQSNPEILHITNDINTLHYLESSLSGGVFIAWQDALYEGPLDTESDLMQLSTQRADYFVETGWASRDEISSRYQIRNEQLCAYQEYKEVVLWFDHDLNSQLQLIQLVDWFARQKMGPVLLSLVSVERLPGINAYLGLNMQSKEKIQCLYDNRWEITLGQMTVCQRAWRALGADNPNALLRFYGEDSAVMPYLKNAVLRYLKQFPALTNGLSHSEHLMSHALLLQQREVNELYLMMQSKESIPFMNQAIYAVYIKNLCAGGLLDVEPSSASEEDCHEEGDLVIESQVVLKLTDLGKQVLHHWVDWVQINGINRWLGGVELTEGCLWRYDQGRRKLIQTYV